MQLDTKSGPASKIEKTSGVISVPVNGSVNRRVVKNRYPETLVFDPGFKSGGYALGNEKEGVKATFNFDSQSDFLNHVRMLKSKGPLKAVIEDVLPYAGKNIPSSAGFKLGRSLGFLDGALQALEIHVDFLKPRVWQAPLSGLAKLSGAPRKRAIKDHATSLYPTLKPTLRTADAVMMAHFVFNNNTQIGGKKHG